MRRESQSDENKALQPRPKRLKMRKTNTSATAKAGAADYGLGRSACQRFCRQNKGDVEQLKQGSL